MEYKEWAPDEVIKAHEGLLQGEIAFSTSSYTIDELNQHAQRNRFPTWSQLKAFLVCYRSCLLRLATDENARVVWEWIADRRVRKLVLSAICRTLEDWYRQPRLSKDECLKEYSEIADLAKRLAGKLALFHGDPNLFAHYPALVPSDYRERANFVVHPELVKRAKALGIAESGYIGAGLPPLHVMLGELAYRAKVATPTKRPRKAKNKSALRALLLDEMCMIIIGNGVKHSSTKFAFLLGLVLDDSTINDATIRGDLKNSEQFKYLSSKDWEQ